MHFPTPCLLIDFFNLLMTLRFANENLHSSKCQDHDRLCVLIISAAQVFACISSTISFRLHRCSAALVWFIFAFLSGIGPIGVCLSATIIAHGSLSFIFIMVRWTNKTRWPTCVQPQPRQSPEPAVITVNTFEI